MRKKTHVTIKQNEGGTATLVVDGVDLSMVVLFEGITATSPAEHGLPWRVGCTIAADVLDVDLPDVLFTAVNGELQAEAS